MNTSDKEIGYERWRLAFFAMIILEIVSATNQLTRDIFINNDKWGNIYSIIGVLALEFAIISLMIHFIRKSNYGFWTVLIVILVILRSSFGAYLNYKNIGLTVSMFYQVLIGVYLLSYFIIRKD